MNNINLISNRILASLIDGLVMFLLLAAVCSAPAIIMISDLMNGNFFTSDLVWLILSFVGAILLWFLYLIITPLIFKSATLGMKIMGLRFTRTNEDELNYFNVVARQGLLLIGLLFSLGFTVFFDIFSVIFSKNCRNFHDIFSTVKVVALDDLR